MFQIGFVVAPVLAGLDKFPVGYGVSAPTRYSTPC